MGTAGGVHRAWRTATILLSAGIAGYAGLSLRRPARPAIVTVRTLSEAAEVDPRLSAVLPAVDFDHVRLADALQMLADRGGLNVVPDWAGMQHTEVQADNPVSIHLKGVSWASALDAVLLAVDPGHESRWVRHGNLVIVSIPGSNALGPPVIRVYDVRPLIDQFARDRAAATEAAARRGNQLGWPPPTDYEVGLDELDSALHQLVDQPSWQENGGQYGYTTILGSELVVCQTEQNHKRLADLLRLLSDRH